jgi:hypothetical protein
MAANGTIAKQAAMKMNPWDSGRACSIPIAQGKKTRSQYKDGLRNFRTRSLAPFYGKPLIVIGE